MFGPSSTKGNGSELFAPEARFTASVYVSVGTGACSSAEFTSPAVQCACSYATAVFSSRPLSGCRVTALREYGVVGCMEESRWAEVCVRGPRFEDWGGGLHALRARGRRVRRTGVGHRRLLAEVGC